MKAHEREREREERHLSPYILPASYPHLPACLSAFIPVFAVKMSFSVFSHCVSPTFSLATCPTMARKQCALPATTDPVFSVSRDICVASHLLHLSYSGQDMSTPGWTLPAGCFFTTTLTRLALLPSPSSATARSVATTFFCLPYWP